MHGLVVPHLVRDDIAVSAGRDREPTTDVFLGDVRGEQKLESPSECRRGSGIPVGQSDCERVEHHVKRARRSCAWLARLARRPRPLRAAGDLDVVGHRAPEGLEIRLAGELGLEGLEATRRAHKQPAGVVAAPLLQRDLGSHQVDLGSAHSSSSALAWMPANSPSAVS